MSSISITTQPELLAVALLLILSLSAAADEGCTDSLPTLENTLARLAADRLDAILGAVADSIRALGDTYGRLAAE
jgi:hypothetical protein